MQDVSARGGLRLGTPRTVETNVRGFTSVEAGFDAWLRGACCLDACSELSTPW